MAHIINGKVDGDSHVKVTYALSIEEAKKDTLSFLANTK